MCEDRLAGWYAAYRQGVAYELVYLHILNELLKREEETSQEWVRKCSDEAHRVMNGGHIREVSHGPANT